MDARMRSLFSDVGVLYAHIVAPPSYERRLPNVATGWGDFLSDDEAPGRDKGEARASGPPSSPRSAPASAPC